VDWMGDPSPLGGGVCARQVESRLFGEGPLRYAVLCSTDSKSEDLSLTWDLDLT
jgi:hypothetical protein